MLKPILLRVEGLYNIYNINYFISKLLSHGDLCDKYKRKKDDDVALTVHDALLYKYP